MPVVELVRGFSIFTAARPNNLNGPVTKGRSCGFSAKSVTVFLGAEMVHPRYRVVGDGVALPQSLTPVYPTTAGVSQTALRKLILPALENADLAELLDPRWCRQHELLPFADAVKLLHAPSPDAPEDELQLRTHPAWRRIKFDEVLAQQLSLRRAYLARRQKGAPVLKAPSQLARRSSLSYRLN